MAPSYDILRRCLGYKFPPLGSAANNLFFRLIPSKIEAELFPGIHLQLDSRDLTQRTTYWQGDRFEYPTAQNISKWMNPSITHFFDIGSNYGFFSYLMLSKFAGLIVHAFEPNPKTFAILEDAKERNRLTRFHPHWMGLSDVQDTLLLHPGISDSGHSTFGPHPELLNICDTPIPVKPFDHWVTSAGLTSPLPRSWIAKIDVEGFELEYSKE